MPSVLFTPKKIGKMVVKNRFVRSPTGDKRTLKDGACSPEMVTFYEELAYGGSGLIITGASYVMRNGEGLPNLMGLHRDENVEGYREMVRAVHKYPGTRIFLQIYHTAYHVDAPNYDFKNWGTPIAPSVLTDEVTGVTSRAMTEEDIQQMINAFAAAARRAKEAEFDGVQLHSAHGYMIHEFLSPATNKRTDKWGGSFENRLRFLIEVFNKVKETVGDDFPIAIKLNMEDYQEGGLTIDLSKRIAERINAMGFDALEISAGVRGERHFNMARGDIPYDYFGLNGKTEYGKRKLVKYLREQAEDVKFKEGYLLPFAREIKKVISIPLIVPGGMRTVKFMEEVIENGQADFIGLCRPLIRDPEFPNKVEKGFVKRSDCLNCNRCLVNKPVMCYQKFYRPPRIQASKKAE